ncbi:hypothetical protein BKH46_06840 [Helicobacter sp. 12S02634-8]|uniref:hypothetical protein n=1 Tax=Helicobacter sp. 12S02634-8 TaxID=1476199 RepID=UPI000BA62155|nr:hypothetical protein [Helicobacter sp. 12S02634-8]PAF46679.1 hypothetical protein BKH46_06840 [Helicobacter sp. 12S02634-8]
MKKILLCLCLLGLLSADSWRDLNELHKGLKEVDLSHRQEKEIKELFKQYHDELKQWWHNNEKVDGLIMHYFTKDSLDTKKIKAQMQANCDRKIEMDMRFLKNLHAILNAKQRDKISHEFHEHDDD